LKQIQPELLLKQPWHNEGKLHGRMNIYKPYKIQMLLMRFLKLLIKVSVEIIDDNEDSIIEMEISLLL
jgi:hypothetical protein